MSREPEAGVKNTAVSRLLQVTDIVSLMPDLSFVVILLRRFFSDFAIGG